VFTGFLSYVVGRAPRQRLRASARAWALGLGSTGRFDCFRGERVNNGIAEDVRTVCHAAGMEARAFRRPSGDRRVHPAR